jgi:hypothetical protein
MAVLTFRQHLARLRSWREPARTGAFFVTYFTAWFLDSAGTAFWLATLILVLSSRARHIAFPPAPRAMVDQMTGKMVPPGAGVLGSTDTMTGAPENMKGEALENEASNFVVSLCAIATDEMMQKDPEDTEQTRSEEIDQVVPSRLTQAMIAGKDKVAGVDKPSQDKTKKPIQKMIWAQREVATKRLRAASDMFERFTKYYSIATSSRLVLNKSQSRGSKTTIRQRCTPSPARSVSGFDASYLASGLI